MWRHQDNTRAPRSDQDEEYGGQRSRGDRHDTYPDCTRAAHRGCFHTKPEPRIDTDATQPNRCHRHADEGPDRLGGISHRRIVRDSHRSTSHASRTGQSGLPLSRREASRSTRARRRAAAPASGDAGGSRSSPQLPVRVNRAHGVPTQNRMHPGMLPNPSTSPPALPVTPVALPE